MFKTTLYCTETQVKWVAGCMMDFGIETDGEGDLVRRNPGPPPPLPVPPPSKMKLWIVICVLALCLGGVFLLVVWSGRLFAPIATEDGRIAIDKGDYPKAERIFTELVKKDEKSNDYLGLAVDLSGLADAYMGNKKIQEAVKVLERCKLVYEELERIDAIPDEATKTYRAGSLRSLALVHIYNDTDDSEGFSMYEESLDIQGRTVYRDFVRSREFLLLARIYLEKNHIPEADRCVQDAIAWWNRHEKEVGDEPWADCKDMMAEVERAKGNIGEAEIQKQIAREIREKAVQRRKALHGDE